MQTFDALNVRTSERGGIRIFTLEMTDGELDRLCHPQGDDPATGAAVAHLLGLDWLDDNFIEIFDVADLDELGLAGYLVQGNDVSKDAVATLKLTSGWVVIIYSGAFSGQAATLHPNRQLNLLGIWHEQRAPLAFDPIHTKSAKGVAIPRAADIPSNPHLTLLWVVLTLPVVVMVGGVLLFILLR